jgi:hypothetical protein
MSPKSSVPQAARFVSQVLMSDTQDTGGTGLEIEIPLPAPTLTAV